MPRATRTLENITVKGKEKNRNITALDRKIPAQTAVIRLFIAKKDLSFQYASG